MKTTSVGKNLVAATKTTMFTVPDEYQAAWTLLYANNAATSAKHFTCWWYDKSADTEVVVLFEYSLSAKSYLKFDEGASIVLEAGDEIRVQSETGASTTCIVTLEMEKKQAVQFN